MTTTATRVPVDNAADSTPPAADARADTGSTPPPPDRPRRRRRLRWGGLDIQSKLLVMLCATTILSSGVVGYIAYRSGTDALRDSAYERLNEVRNSRAREVTRSLETLRKNMVVYTRGTTVNQATKDFTAGFAALSGASVTPAQTTALKTYYDEVFIAGLNKNRGTDFSSDAFLPTSPAQQYLQSYYTSPFKDFDEAIKLDDAGDGSAWSAAHAKYQAYFRTLTTEFNYDDALLIDNDGNVVYSAYGGVDLGSNLETGPFRDTNLAQAYTTARDSNETNYVGFTDLARYQPSYGIPTGWTVSPVGQNGVNVGVLAIQIPITTVNAVMTGDAGWKRDGLGSTGETFLVGQDRLMRSTSRMAMEDPKQYERLAVAAGTPESEAATAARVKGTILIQKINTAAAGLALTGKTGETVETDYLGEEALIAYAPVRFEGQNWAIIAKISTAEVFAPVDKLARNIIISTLAIIFIVCLASILLAQVFARPMRRLIGGVQAVAAGQLGTQVYAGRGDEFGDLGAAFNDMSRSLQVKQQLLDEQLAENRRLLLTIMPEAVADRYAQGEETISEERQDVTVIFADLAGWEDNTAAFGSVESLSLLNGVFRSMDDAAQRLGVERIRTVRDGYLASCGLTVPRIDHQRRVLDLALEMQRIVERFNAQHGTTVGLRAGVDTGTVSGGLVGGSVAYDMWGEAVSLAYRLRSTGGRAGVFVTDRVASSLRDNYAFSAAGDITSGTATEPVWSLNGSSR